MKATYITIIIVILLGLGIYLAVKFNTQNNTNMTAQVSDVNTGGGNVDKSQMTAQNGDTVFVNYTGTLTNGKKFDSSLDHGKPIDFVLGTGRVIRGWDEGIVGMKIGDKKTLTLPPELAYGDGEIPDGQGGILIPANSTLIFDIELVDIQR